MILQTLSEYLEYLEIEKGLSENTIDSYRRDLSYFLDKFESYKTVVSPFNYNGESGVIKLEF